MRALLFSLIAVISIASPSMAQDLRGVWLDNKAWDGVQAVVQMYDCEDGSGLCARIVRAYHGQLAAGQENYLLIRGVKPRGAGTFEGIINPPVSFVGDSKVTIKIKDAVTISYSSCFLPVCKGTMTRMQ